MELDKERIDQLEKSISITINMIIKMLWKQDTKSGNTSATFEEYKLQLMMDR